MSDKRERAWAARAILSQSALLQTLKQSAGTRDEWVNWKRVYQYAVELADPKVDPRVWADAHVEHGKTSDRWGMLEPAAHQALEFSLVPWATAQRLDDKMFTIQGAPVGPLASLELFSTDFSAWDVPEPGSYRYGGSKAHAPGFCQHADRITAGEPYNLHTDDVLTYGEFIPRLAAHRGYARDHYGSSFACSKCGGITMRLLDDEQLHHLDRVRDELAKSNGGTTGKVVPLHQR
jgi:hypothetical protein